MHSDTATHSDKDPARTEVQTPADLLGRAGQRLGTSPWITVGQAEIDDFARITRDEQWIHIDQARAGRRSVRQHHRAWVLRTWSVRALHRRDPADRANVDGNQLRVGSGSGFSPPVPEGGATARGRRPWALLRRSKVAFATRCRSPSSWTGRTNRRVSPMWWRSPMRTKAHIPQSGATPPAPAPRQPDSGRESPASPALDPRMGP